MKHERRRLPTKALFTALLFGVSASVFGIGFASFVLSDPSVGQLGSVQVGVGDAALVEVESNSITPFTCSQQGFLQPDHKYGYKATLSLSFRYFVDSEDVFTFDFSFSQNDTVPEKNPDFNFSSYVTKMTLSNRRTEGGAVSAKKEMIPAPIAGKKAVHATCSTDEIRALGSGITFFMTLDIQLDVSSVCATGSAIDFAKNIYYPLHENQCSFDVGIDVYA